MRDFRNSLWLIARDSVRYEAPVWHRVAGKCTKHKGFADYLGNGCSCL
jgi:hypothetical protein